MIGANIQKINQEIGSNVRLIAVSKTKPVEALLEAYQAGQKLFGENKVQELVVKYESLPKDIEWHFIGHLQSNKIKYIAPIVSLIHSVDSLKLLQTINKEGQKINRIIPCLLQIFIASEETKFGLNQNELCVIMEEWKKGNLANIEMKGLMGMASNVNDTNQIEKEFTILKILYDETKAKYFSDIDSFNELSMGMSGDYAIAIKAGSTLVRVGSSIFGSR
jgi:pyridoxal phosphate enzyme (YggS family)